MLRRSDHPVCAASVASRYFLWRIHPSSARRGMRAALMDRKILVVSDATGSTAEHVLRAALAQFEADDVLVERRPQVRTIQDVCRVVDEAHRTGAMLVHTLASVDLRREIYFRATERRVQSVDLLGNVLSDLSAFLGAAP